jgi:hypothetical protein
VAPRRTPLPISFACAIVAFFALDGLLFRTGFYASILEPDSTAGSLQMYLWNERHRTPQNNAQVLGVGDSRMGLKPRIANGLATGYTFATIAVPGTTPRCWYYMLRDVDPDANRYAAILFPLNSYDDRDYEDLNERELDVHYLAPLLRLADTPDFTFSFSTWPGRKQALTACLLKGVAYQRDVQDLLAHFGSRIERVRQIHKESAGWIYDAVWTDRSMAGMQVDWASRRAELPASGFRPEQLSDMRAALFRDLPPRSANAAAYRVRWFGRIVARYRGSRTRLIFFRLPRGPVVRPGTHGDPNGTIRGLAARGEIVLLPEHDFDSLERPELFGDLMHLNEAGSREFTALLAGKVRSLLGRADGSGAKPE